MTEAPDEWVCLECYNRWQPRSEPDDKAQCSNADCRGRFTFPLPLVKRHVRDVRSLIDEQIPPIGKAGKLPTPLSTLPSIIESGREMVEEADRPRAAQGLNLLDAIKDIIREWEGEESEPIEDAIDRLHASK